MNNSMIEVNQEPLRDGQTVTVDHCIQEYTVKIRSLSGVHPDTVKKMLQNKWEVLEVNQVALSQFVRRTCL